MAAPKVGAARNEMAMERAPGPPQDGAEAPNAPAPGGAGDVKAPNPPAKEPKIEQPRKIKYNADLRVVVTDFDEAWKGLKIAVKDAKGFSSKEDIQGSAGSQRTGSWTIRVPVEKIDSFRDAVVKLGKAERNNLTSEDITAQYYDLAEHIKNKQAEREAVRKLLEKTGDRDLQQYFVVKRELDQINDHINRQEGQLRLWGNLADLSTVTVHLREVQRIDDADKKVVDREEPSFGQRAERSWTKTWDLFIGFWEWVAIAAIFVAPWAPFPIVGLLFLWVMVRLLFRASRKESVVLEVAEDQRAPVKKKVKKEEPSETQ
jgi:hypothetical protein